MTFSTGKSAIIVVDVQNDFCEGGALAVEGGSQVARDVTAYLDNHYGQYAVRAASRDWHAPPPSNNLGHFALDGEPDYNTSWPVHCVAKSPGADFHPEFLALHLCNLTVRKGYGCHSYSAFEAATVAGGNTILGQLRSHNVEQVDVVGLAFDYCVRATALDASRLGYDVRVIKALTASVHPEKDWVTETILDNNGVFVDRRLVVR